MIPFAGSDPELEQLLGRASRLRRGPADAVVIVDNRPRGRAAVAAYAGPELRLLAAPDRRSSYHARNRGAATGEAAWLLFLDADVEWPEDLIDRYFGGPTGERVAVLAGAVADAPLAGGHRATPAERYGAERGPMAQTTTVHAPQHPPYAQTANCLVRRAAFEAVGGFSDGIRSGGDADLCFRLQAAGWTVELCEAAGVVHRNRRALGSLLMQKARHGAGAAWLDRRYAGTFPPRRRAGLAAWSARSILAALRQRRGAVAVTLVEVLAVWAFELGRLLPNSARPSSPRRRR